ncbi:ferrochelatase [soil metagenome]
MPQTPDPKPPSHPAVLSGRIGVLIVNLGTPEAPHYWPMRRYLKEFLSDRRVIETNPVLWWFILNGVILTIRPGRSGQAYEKIWNRERDESPLKTITRAQSEMLGAAFTGDARIRVRWAMRYGLPPIAEELHALKDEGCDRILIFPLYPQYSAATNATVADKVFDVLKPMRWQPAIRIVPPYYEHPAYIGALAASLETGLATLPWKPDRILASFHGLPQSYFDAGDPYYCHCHKTTRLLAEAMELPDGLLSLVFQSRFGRTEWLKPYAQQTVERLPAAGIKNLIVIMPGFSADCVETLEEVGIGLRETFLHHGGENFATIPCLNDSAPSISMLAAITRQELQGWI